MSLTQLLLLSVPATLAALKLAALALAAIWAVRVAFESRDLLPAADDQPHPVRSRTPLV